MGAVKSLVAVESVHRGPHVKAIPDVILPSQFFELVGIRTLSSEQRLMLAVLADAINVLGECRASPVRDKRNSFNEASSWVFANCIASSLPFDHVCYALGVDAGNLRRRLSELVSEHGGNFRKLRLRETGRMPRVTLNRAHRR
jgi:hypothetical protein